VPTYIRRIFRRRSPPLESIRASGDIRGFAAEGFRMLDVILIAGGLAFFGLALLYTDACERL